MLTATLRWSCASCIPWFLPFVVQQAWCTCMWQRCGCGADHSDEEAAQDDAVRQPEVRIRRLLPERLQPPVREPHRARRVRVACAKHISCYITC